ncbi:signal transduction protein [Halobacteriales archaeon SW_5_70_135]|nr:MAG: signal transduction protein [Halobacteriales archaeon SW_5_70_135]
MDVADVMTPRSSVVTVELPGTRDDALEYLQERAFSSVPVVKQEDGRERYRGIVTRNALIETPDEDQLALLMEETPTVRPTESVEALARLMTAEEEYRVPVVDDEFDGIVTVTDVVRAVAHGDVATDAAVESVSVDEINTVYAATPLPVAERELYYADVPYAVVLDDAGEMAGVLTEVDVLAVAEIVEGEAITGQSMADQDDAWMWQGVKDTGSRYMPTRNVSIPDDPVREYMTADVVTVSPRKSVREAAQLLIANEIEQLPVVGGGDLVGIVRDADLLGALLQDD